MKTLILSLILINFGFGFAGSKFCGGENSTSRTDSKATQSEFVDNKYAYIVKNFGPDDGPALSINVVDKKQDCGNFSRRLIRVSIWKDITEVSEKEFSFPNEKLGHIYRVEPKTLSKKAKKGTIKFAKSDRKNDVEFDLDVELEDGEKFKGKLKATWCKDAIYPGHPDSQKQN